MLLWEGTGTRMDMKMETEMVWDEMEMVRAEWR